jgi:hypothetical protein
MKTQLDTVLARIARAAPAAYAMRTDRFIAEKTVALAIFELPNAKPIRVQLTDAPNARGPVLSLLRTRLDLERDASDALLQDLRTLADTHPYGAWPLQTDGRAVRAVTVEGDSIRSSLPLPEIASDLLRLAARCLPPHIPRVLIHELRISGADKREIKRHFVRFEDRDGNARASLAWMLAMTHVLYRTNPHEGDEPEANDLRLTTWAAQLGLTPDGLVDLLVALNTPVTLFGATQLSRNA